MSSFAAKTVLAVAVAAATIVPLSSASAGDWDRRDRRDAAILGGVLGLAAGVAVGSAMSRPAPAYEERVYVDEPSYIDEEPDYRYYRAAPQPVYRPAPVYRAQPVYDSRPVYNQRRTYRTIEPWTNAWYDYCSQRYRSFNTRTGTYTDYDGQRHFCVAG
ncbi:BA14K family protein [Agrobacterium tumefaciens]|uniref:BA14K family protein n=1 Tax=Agrobacterium TaxID=357 RepID=UPI00098EDC02|nr:MULTISPECIES: BA14K family protein [Agrobacterium]MCZ7494969.1 BA14K family protein [Rhizobium rhizogenes]MDA5245089.1 BA14K family protein [Agrobacterium sp. MAFF310724]MDA5246482.1 BA14K family protein [Agrobacterium sp. MAFF210268]NSZ04643.1 BA14K family protein [Agrobacterium tumefaciens]NSZ36195.1 BA14K family protein [Agrobacterium tumefaciens]